MQDRLGREHIGRNFATAHSIYILIYENVHGIQFPAAIPNTHIFDSSSSSPSSSLSSWACWEREEEKRISRELSFEVKKERKRKQKSNMYPPP